MKKLTAQYLKDGASVAKGSTTLSIIPKEMNCVDLLVREAIQNSSDAGLIGAAAPFVGVDFDLGDFDAPTFNSLFDTNVEQVLNDRFHEKKCRWLSITDYNTEGLNGKTVPESVTIRSNFCRLINDTGEAQIKEGAGGSCGYGKSAYYRLGSAGIVIFYSRFRDESCKFHSRLVVTLVEDEKKDDAILVRAGVQSSAGKAWWGAGTDGSWIQPLEDDARISEILGIFGISRYEDMEFPDRAASQTGTKIIIPYIDEKAVLHSLAEGRTDYLKSDQLRQVEEMTKDMATALQFAVLRWYSPRLANRYLKEFNKYQEPKHRISRLTVRVCGEPVFPDVTRFDFFVAVQDLYNRALYEILKINNPEVSRPSCQTFALITCERCDTRGVLNTPLAGVVAFGSFQSKTKSNISPYILTNNFASAPQASNPAMLFFLREPGMVIGYSTTDEWLKNVPESEGNDYLLAVFYPNSSNIFKSNVDTVPDKLWGITVGEYLRSCEQADHTSWKDQNGGRLAQRIKATCANKILRIVDDTDVQPPEGAVGRLAILLGQRLLPHGKGESIEKLGKKQEDNDTTVDSRMDARKGKSRIAKSGKSSLVLSEYEFPRPHVVSMSFKMIVAQGTDWETLLLQLSTSEGSIDAVQWRDRADVYDGKFPIRLLSVKINTARAGETESSQPMELQPEGNIECNVCDDIKVQLFQIGGTPVGLKISRHANLVVTLEGLLTVYVENPILRFMLGFSSRPE